MALLEETVTDPGTGRIANATLADYLVPVNADIPDLDVLFVGESDRFNPIGVKGVGEMGLMASPPPSPTPYFTPPAGASGPCPSPSSSFPDLWTEPPSQAARHWRGGEAGRMAASTPGMRRWLTRA
jgi:hypothetical protein